MPRIGIRRKNFTGNKNSSNPSELCYHLDFATGLKKICLGWDRHERQ